jgi:hypothetical protein
MVFETFPTISTKTSAGILCFNKVIVGERLHSRNSRGVPLICVWPFCVLLFCVFLLFMYCWLFVFVVLQSSSSRAAAEQQPSISRSAAEQQQSSSRAAA